VLATNALADACGFTNPRIATQADIEGIFQGAMA
jgi:alcohol dehydrogenase